MTRYRIGQLIHHRRYGYRGVVVSVDTVCQADDEWYERNRTQPDRDQPWYHVVVDDASHMTYVAQSNLEADASDAAVRNPMLYQFDLHYHDGRYYTQSLN